MRRGLDTTDDIAMQLHATQSQKEILRNVFDEDDVEDGRRTHQQPVAHHVHENQIAKSASQEERLHQRLQRLIEEETMLLATDGLSDADKAALKEKFFHDQMDIMLRLPQHEKERYNPEKRKLNRLGTVRNNVYNEEEEEYPTYFSYGVLFFCVLGMVWAIGENGWEFASQDENPMIGPSNQALLDVYAKEGYEIRNRGQVSRLFIPIFLHAGLVHLLVSVVLQWRLLWSLEESFGPWRTAAIFIPSGIFGWAVSAIFLPDVLGTGATGALFGVVGAMYGDFIQNYRNITEGHCVYLTELLIGTFFGLAIGIFPLIDNFAHIGGLIYGVFAGLTFLTGHVRDSNGKHVTTWYTMPLVVVSFLIQIGLWVTVLSVLWSDQSGEEWCSWCTSVNCVDTPYWDCQSCVVIDGTVSCSPPA